MTNNILYVCKPYGLIVYDNESIIGSYPIENFKERTPTFYHYDRINALQVEAVYWAVKTNTQVSFIEKERPFILIQKIGKFDPLNLGFYEKWLVSYNEDKLGWIGVNAWLNNYIELVRKTGEQ